MSFIWSLRQNPQVPHVLAFCAQVTAVSVSGRVLICTWVIVNAYWLAPDRNNSLVASFFLFLFVFVICGLIIIYLLLTAIAYLGFTNHLLGLNLHYKQFSVIDLLRKAMNLIFFCCIALVLNGLLFWTNYPWKRDPFKLRLGMRVLVHSFSHIVGVAVQRIRRFLIQTSMILMMLTAVFNRLL